MPGAAAPRRRPAPPQVVGLYKPGLDEAQAQALLPDSHPEMPREQPRLGYCSTSLLPSPTKEKQQEKHLTSPLPARHAAGWGGGADGDQGRGQTESASLLLLSEAELSVKLGQCHPGRRAQPRGSLVARCWRCGGDAGHGDGPQVI